MKFKNLHSWNVSVKKAQEIQESLKDKIKITPYHKNPTLIAGADAHFKGNLAVGAVVVVKYPEEIILEKVIRSKKTYFPYIPGLFSFREGPVLLECFRKLKTIPDIVIFDAHGLAHPRKMGLATHLGMILDLPTIGCAKSYLYGRFSIPEKIRGRFRYIYDQSKNKIGLVLVTRNNTNPLFISPGYKMDIQSAKRIILMCTPKFRIPQPLRLVHSVIFS